jgi:iron complex transport system permease protein
MDLVPFIALAGGLLAGGLVLWLSWNGDLDPTRTALSGVALGAVASAAVMAMVLAMGNSQAEVALIWLAGSLYGRGYEEALAILPWTGAGLVAAALILRPLGASRFDADIARSIGLETRLWRPLALAIAVALAASAVSVVGPVGFVGLVVPHTARLVVGSSLPRQMAFGALFGALLVAASDVLGRIVAVPVEVPVGAVTSLIGVPVFLILLQQRGGSLK